MRVSIILMGFGLALGPTLIAGSVQARSDDHLQCYRIKDPLRLEGFVDISSMQFGLERGCEISTAVLFCVPADDENLEVRDERRENEGDHDDEDDSDSDGASSKITLLPLSARPAPGDRICYRVRCPRSDAPVIEVTDPFGTRTIRRFRTRMLCTPAVKGTEHCGDGSITGTEECEPTDDSACPGLCSPDCSCGASQPTCGNGLLDPNEDCDFGDLGGATCWDQGFSFGTLACGAGCTFDTSGCTDTRFVDNGDGTVSDNQTGLMWEKKVAGSGCLHCVGDRYTWFDAMGDWISEVNGFTFSGKKTQFGLAGHSDWRIPKVSELENIILLLNVNVPCPRRACIDPIFGPTGGTFYWSSSTFGSHPSSAWVIPFWFHGIGSGGFDKLSTSRVRAVRGGL